MQGLQTEKFWPYKSVSKSENPRVDFKNQEIPEDPVVQHVQEQ